MPVRLQKYLASCGIGSRRQCERWISEGRVIVDGDVVREMGTAIDPERAEICFNGRVVKPERTVYLALNKPPGYVCTSHDPQGRPRALDLVDRPLGRLYTIGRLDTDSEGLILLTNDGDFAHRLMHPRHEIEKTYRLWLKEPLVADEFSQWKKGVNDRGERLNVLAIRAVGSGRSGHEYEVRLGEGRNRHLRRMAAAFGKTVLRLQRIAIGPLLLGRMKRGEWRSLSSKELQTFNHDAPNAFPSRVPDR